MRPGSHQHAFMFPLALLAAAYALGTVIGLRVTVPHAVTIPVTLLCSLLSVISLLRDRKRIATVLLVLSFLLSGATLAFLEIVSVAPGSVKQLVQSGIIRDGEPVEIT